VMSLHATKRENIIKMQERDVPKCLLNFNAIDPIKNKPAPQLKFLSTSTYLGNHHPTNLNHEKDGGAGILFIF